MTQHDDRAEVQLLTAIALQNCTTSSTNKTYSSAWTAGFGYRKCISILLISWALLHITLYHWRQYKRHSSNISAGNVEGACSCPNLYGTASWIPWTNQWSMTYSGLRLSLICVLDGYQNLGARQHPPSNSIIIPFTRVLAKVSIRLLRTGQFKPNGLNYSGTSFLEKLMQAQLYAALIFGIFYLLCKSEYLRRSVMFFDHQITRIAYCTVKHIPARSIRLIIDFQNWTR